MSTFVTGALIGCLKILTNQNQIYIERLASGVNNFCEVDNMDELLNSLPSGQKRPIGYASRTEIFSACHRLHR